MIFCYLGGCLEVINSVYHHMVHLHKQIFLIKSIKISEEIFEAVLPLWILS